MSKADAPLTADQKLIEEMADRFLAWPLPQSVCADLCATDHTYKFPRSGTNLLNATEARLMVEHITAPLRAHLQELDELVSHFQDGHTPPEEP